MLYTLGLIVRQKVRAKEDADVVKSFKDAGAILIATTNIPEVNMWQETRNNLFGQTKNPYNTTRTVGGSSGGESSLIASCGTGAGIGTDIGGSLRMPAYFCGIFAHKPTSFLISTKGLSLRTGTEGDTMVSKILQGWLCLALIFSSWSHVLHFHRNCSRHALAP